MVNSNQNYNNCRLAWLEQREFFNVYLDTVRDHPVYNIIQDELNDAFNNTTRPNLDYFKEVSPTETFGLFQKSSSPVSVAFDKTLGSIANLSRTGNIYWTDATSQLASYVYITYNESDFAQLSNTYGNPGNTHSLSRFGFSIE